MSERQEPGRQSENEPQWIRPNFENERGEITRVIGEFLNQEPTEAKIKEVVAAVEEAPMSELSDEEWERLENTDSFDQVNFGALEDAEQITAKYNKDLPPENKRNFQKLLSSFRDGSTMECPVIIRNAQGTLHLVSGNTRLMIARALGIRPKVILCEI